MNYIVADHLKYKRTFLKKVLILAPIAAVLHAYILMPAYFSVNAYNWWYTVLMPFSFALIPALMHRYENRKLKYKAIFPLNVDLHKIWLSKITIALYFAALIMIVHLLGVYFMQLLIPIQLSSLYGLRTMVTASLILLAVDAWQLPFCLFLSKKMGFMFSLACNALLGIFMGILLADTKYWLYCPYSWGARCMVSILKIMPNGVPVGEEGMGLSCNPLIPCILSLFLFGLISFASAGWFAKQEVK